MARKLLSRRDMLKASALAVAGSVLIGCTPQSQPASTVQPTQAPEQPKEEEPKQAPPAEASGHVVIMHFLHEFTEDHAAAFTAENPSITVEILDASDQTRFFAMYAAGTPPDLLRVQAPSIPQFLSRKLLLDLTPYFEASQLVPIEDLLPANNYYKAGSPLDIGAGKIYGMVKDFSPDLTLYAYKPIFEEAGLPVPDDTQSMSYNDVMETARQVIKKEGDRFLTFGYGYETSWADRFWMVALSELRENLYTEDYEKMVLTENDDARNVVKWYHDMAKENLTFSALNPSPNGWFGTDFTAGQLALAQYGFWFSAMAESDTTRGNVVMLPAPNWAGVRKDPTITATGMIITAATKAPEAAWKLFEWYNGGPPSVERAQSGWGVPALRSQIDLIPQETDFQKQANKVLQGELALNDEPVQFNPYLGEAQVSTAFTKFLEQALNGTIDFETMLRNIESEVNEAIQDGISTIKS